MWKQQLVSILNRELTEIKKKNPRYSLRAYSKKIGVGFGSMSDLINRKRSLSPQLGKKILEKLALEKAQVQRFSDQINKEIAKTVTLVPREAQLLVENWYYFAILNILALESCPKSNSEIADRLGLTETTVERGLASLVDWGFLLKSESDYLVVTNDWETSDGIPSESIKKSHLGSLDLARKAVLNLSVEQRDLTSFVFNGNSEQLDKVRGEIRKFMKKVNKQMSVGQSDSVFKINIQLFPIDQWNNRK